jgi:hypothetical protein
MKPQPLWACAILALFCSCAATSVQKTWTAPNRVSQPAKIAVLTIDDRGWLRQAFENRFVAELKQVGASALATFDLLTLTEIKGDQRAAAQHFQTNGADSLLIMRLVESDSSYHEMSADTERYATSGNDAVGWYDFFSMGFMGMSPTYGSLTQRFYLETILYDLKTGKRFWAGITRTVIKDNTDRANEMDRLVKKIVASMRKDGVIP